MTTTPVEFLQHRHIDKARWDACVANAANSLLYATSTYLDAMSPGWHALIQGHYEAVMPVTWRSKLGVSYLCQPAFTQQLGVFSKSANPPQPLLERFLLAISHRYPLTEIFLNHQNQVPNACSTHNNFVLNLSASYTQTAGSYKSDLQKNLARAQKFNLQYLVSQAVEEALELYQQTYGQRMRIRPQDYRAFTQLCTNLATQQQAFVRKVQLPSGELLAIGLFLTDGRRIYNIASTTLPNGRTLEANHVLFDRLIHEFSGQPLLLDFEGSDLPGVARFYQKFGAENQPYFFWKSNRLPAVMRWWKR
ncbi:MAG: GNAT family N-acetyltransferase [Bacteroidetes bacterium]|nr:MAG: GNAT family N-acetyltransferase [Bacteroidota bacterium]